MYVAIQWKLVVIHFRIYYQYTSDSNIGLPVVHVTIHLKVYIAGRAVEIRKWVLEQNNVGIYDQNWVSTSQ